MARRCDRCGVESDLEGVYFETGRFVGRKRTYCPACWADRWRREGVSTLRHLASAAVLGTAAALVFPRFFAGWMLLNLVLFEVATLAATVPHELGHAFVARRLGVRVFRIVVGFGRLAWRGRLLGFEVEVRSVPIGGLTLTGFREARGFRIRHFLVVLAGPAVNASFVAAVLLALPPEALWRSPFSGLAPWGAFALANALTLAINLAPLRLASAQGQIQSDGYSLLTTPFLDRAHVDRILALGYALEGLEARSTGRFDEALAWAEDGLARFPDDAVLENARIAALIDLGRHEEARAHLLALLEGDPDPESRTIAWNNLAWTDLLSGRPDLLEEADRYSEEAHRRAAWAPPIQSTRGAILVERGRIEEGIELLAKALRDTEAPADRAAVACSLAVAEARRGNAGSAERYARTARALHPGDQTERLLARAGGAAPRTSASTRP